MDQVSAQPSQIVLPDNMPFIKASISQLGLRTPPPSPEDTKSNPRQHHSRFTLPKFLRRTQQARSPTLLTQNGSSTEGSPLPGSDNAPSHPTCSPFRTVQHTKEPFPLLLPVSAASSSCSADQRTTPQRLRKVSLSYQNLRSPQSNQHLDSKTLKPLALLPSPVLSELPTYQITRSYFTNGTSEDQQMLADGLGQAHSLYEDHGMFTSYCDEDKTQTCHQKAEHTRETLPVQIPRAVKNRRERRRDVGIVCAPSSFPQYQRRSQCDRSRSYSSEANWLAGTMSEKIMLEEWLSDLHQSATADANQDDDEDDLHQVVCVQNHAVRPRR